MSAIKLGASECLLEDRITDEDWRWYSPSTLENDKFKASMD